MTTNYQFNNGGTTTDFDDVFIRKDLFSTGGLWVWGQNSSGELGTNNRTNYSSPVQTISGGTNWKQISAGGACTAAIKTDGTLWLWGSNFDGELGTNNRTYYSSPVQTVAGGTNWKQVSCGSSTHTAAVKTDGTLWLWGSNSQGELGTNNRTYYSSPVQTISGGTNWKQVSAGGVCTAAIKTDGTLWVWGRNIYGNLGTNNTTSYSSPVQTTSGGTNWKQVSAGDSHTAAIKTDGTLWLCGLNSAINNLGKLGTNDTIDRSSLVQTVASGTNWKQVSCGNSQTAAIKSDGTLWLWGDGFYGTLGDGSILSKSSPVQTVAGGTNWKYVSTGGRSTLAIKNDGTLWVWGNNNTGQLGLNDLTNRISPVQVITGGVNWKTAANQTDSSFGIIEDFY